MTALEFGLIGPAALALLLMTFDFGYQLAVDMALQFGTASAARYGITGAVSGAAANNASTVGTMIVSNSGNLLNSANLTVSASAYSSATSYAANGAATSNNFGGSSSVVIYSVTYVAPFLTGVPYLLAKLVPSGNFGTSITHKATVVVQNEPY